MRGLSKSEEAKCSAADSLLNAMEGCLRDKHCTGIVELPRRNCLIGQSSVILDNSDSALYIKSHCKLGLSGFLCDSGQPTVEPPIIRCECLRYFISPEFKVCGRTAEECTHGCTLATCDNCRPVCNNAAWGETTNSTPLMQLVWHRIMNGGFDAANNASDLDTNSSIFVDA